MKRAVPRIRLSAVHTIAFFAGVAALMGILLAALPSAGAASPGTGATAPAPAPAPVPGSGSAPDPAPAPAPEVAELPAATLARARSLLAEAVKAPDGWNRLRFLTDTIGNRIAGSTAEPRAVVWARQEFERDGVPVRLEKVMVPVWVRGEESAQIVSPVVRPIVMLGLGLSVGTPGAGEGETGSTGLTAPLLVVADEDGLKALGREKVQGKIVLFDHPFYRTGDEMHDYGEAVKYRAAGPSMAARLGAVACLVRSVATSTLRTPHTGGTWYDKDAPKIPAAAVSIEDAMLLHRLFETGTEVRVELVMNARTLEDREGANVVAEIRGREKPDEIVLIGAHLDSWDVGQGAIDDGAGCAMVLETMRLLAAGPPPRRTVRAVLFANEENGGRGGKAYLDAHRAEMDRHVAAMESDSGGGRPQGFGLTSGAGGESLLRGWLAPVLAPLGATRVRGEGGGADVGAMIELGVPGLSIEPDTTRYFDWHHTEADTLDKLDPGELQESCAAFAVVTWILADAPGTLPRPAPKIDKAEK